MPLAEAQLVIEREANRNRRRQAEAGRLRALMAESDRLLGHAEQCSRDDASLRPGFDLEIRRLALAVDPGLLRVVPGRSIGRRVGFLMALNGWSAKSLGAAIGVDHRAIDRIRASNGASFLAVEVVCQALNAGLRQPGRRKRLGSLVASDLIFDLQDVILRQMGHPGAAEDKLTAAQIEALAQQANWLAGVHPEGVFSEGMSAMESSTVGDLVEHDLVWLAGCRWKLRGDWRVMLARLELEG